MIYGMSVLLVTMYVIFLPVKVLDWLLQLDGLILAKVGMLIISNIY